MFILNNVLINTCTIINQKRKWIDQTDTFKVKLITFKKKRHKILQDLLPVLSSSDASLEMESIDLLN